MFDLKKIVYEARTCRRFQPDYDVSYEVLEELVDMARVTPSARNGQHLRYALINKKEACARILPTYALAGVVKSEESMLTGEEPNAYIAILGPDKLSEWSTIDIGISAQMIQLAASVKGLGACMIGAYNGEKLLDALVAEGLDVVDPISLQKPEAEKIQLRVRMLIALGKPIETRKIVEISPSDPVMYYKENGEHIVPKRVLSDIIIFKS